MGTFYVYDGDKVLGEVSSAGVVTAAYTWGADGLVSERLPTASPAKSLWYLFGPQGETRQLTTSTGLVVDSYTYTAYGKPVFTSYNNANPFRYGGKYGYYSENNEPVLCGHRWYDATTLRWLSRDPILTVEQRETGPERGKSWTLLRLDRLTVRFFRFVSRPR